MKMNVIETINNKTFIGQLSFFDFQTFLLLLYSECFPESFFDSFIVFVSIYMGPPFPPSELSIPIF